MTGFDPDLARNPANFQPLTPLSFLERAAETFPDHVAVVHGRARLPYRDLLARSRRLASALAGRGSDVATWSPSCWPTRRRCWNAITACRCAARC